MLPIDRGTECRRAALRGFAVKRESGNALGSFVGVLLLVLVTGFLVWRFAPEYLPGVVRAELPRSPLDFSPSDGAPGVAAAPTTAAAPARAENPPLYKWRDANGVLNVTDVPPVGREYETVRVNPDTNVLPSETAPETPDG